MNQLGQKHSMFEKKQGAMKPHPILHSPPLISGLSILLILPLLSLAASFDGTARVEVADPTGSLSWSSLDRQFTVSCWLRISLPSGQTISNDMAIVVNRRTGSETDACAYHVRVNSTNGAVEFVTRGNASGNTFTLIDRPYLDRWYHVAVVRYYSTVSGFVDGREVFTYSVDVGDTAVNSDGVSIGGWGTARYFRGEIQELRIYQSALSASQIRDSMFMDLSANPPSQLRAYFKLSASTNAADYYRNSAFNPPTGTDPGVAQGTGSVTFEETDQAGEQSLFDAMKNQGASEIVPLSGSFTWEDKLLGRATPGMPFNFSVAYNSAIASASSKIGTFDPFENPSLGKGWRHVFETRLAPESVATQRRIILWNGSIETWDKVGSTWQTRHKEYRGELSELPNGDYEWITPARLTYRFKDPTSGLEAMQGRLYEISDFSSNVVRILYNTNFLQTVVTQVVDTAGGVMNFNYRTPQLLTNVSYLGWSVNFEYDLTNRLLLAYSMTGPSAYSNLNTRFTFAYSTNSQLLERITDPRTNISVWVAYDAYGRRTLEMDALNRSNRWEYGQPAKRQIRLTDPEGKQTVQSYDRKQRMLSSTDPLNHTATYAYDEFGNVVAQTDPLGRTTLRAYDSRANIIAVTNALTQVSRWMFHSFFNLPVQETDPLGWTTTSTYDGGGRLVSKVDSLGLRLTNTYYANGLLETTTDGNGRTSSFVYNTNGFLTARTDPATNTWYFAYTELGWLLAETNPLTQVTTFTYDLNGKQRTRTDPIMRVFARSFDPNCNLVAESDGKQQFTYFFYDAANQLTQKIDRAGATNRFTYTLRGKVQTVTDAVGNVVSNAYDIANRLVATFDPEGWPTTFEYDAADNLTNTLDKLSQRWVKQCDALNRIIAETDPQTNTVTRTFDAAGRLQSLTSPRHFTTLYEYDGRGRLTRFVDPERLAWRYDYDAVGNITNITDALGGRYVMAYGPRNERLRERNQDGLEWLYEYDELLRVTRETDPNGRVREVIYDKGGRIDFVQHSSGRYDDYTSDENDNIRRIVRTGSDLPVSADFAFDPMDRLISYFDPFGQTVGYSYDPAGRLATTTYPGSKAVTHYYDRLSRLTNQVTWAGPVAYAYDKAGRLIRRAYPNGVVQTNAFDNAGRLTALNYTSPGGQLLAGFVYAYDGEGNKTSATETNTLGWPEPSGFDVQAAFTPAGRIISRDEVITNHASRISYQYDPAGNLTNATSPNLSWFVAYDEDNRVTSFDYLGASGTNRIRNRYDVLGRRISRTKDATEIRYVLDPTGRMERILCDLNPANQPTAWYVHGPDLCFRVDTSGHLTCYHADAMGNVLFTTDAAGNKISQYAYAPYGAHLAQHGDATDPYRFVGSQGVMEDLTNIYFMRARYYSADLGVFLSTDPVERIGPSWRSVAYQYCRANPINHVDPVGTTDADIEFYNEYSSSYGTTFCLLGGHTIVMFGKDSKKSEAAQKLTDIHEQVHVNQCREGRYFGTDKNELEIEAFDAEIAAHESLKDTEDIGDEIEQSYAGKNAAELGTYYSKPQGNMITGSTTYLSGLSRVRVDRRIEPAPLQTPQVGISQQNGSSSKGVSSTYIVAGKTTSGESFSTDKYGRTVYTDKAGSSYYLKGNTRDYETASVMKMFAASKGSSSKTKSKKK